MNHSGKPWKLYTALGCLVTLSMGSLSACRSGKRPETVSSSTQLPILPSPAPALQPSSPPEAPEPAEKYSDSNQLRSSGLQALPISEALASATGPANSSLQVDSNPPSMPKASVLAVSSPASPKPQDSLSTTGAGLLPRDLNPASPAVPRQTTAADASSRTSSRHASAEGTTVQPAAQSKHQPSKLRIRITNIRPGEGMLNLAISSSASSFPQSKTALKVRLAPTQQVLEYLLLTDESSVAIAAYQDIDGNTELTRNRLGIPVEPFGFSNNPTIQRGPPSFEAARIELSPGRDGSESVTQIDLP